MISAIEWVDGTLTITWSSGKSTDFHNIPEQEYHSFISAPSAGKYFHGTFKAKYS
mgnify:FL=1